MRFPILAVFFLFLALSASADEFTVEDAVAAAWYVDVGNAIPVVGGEGEYAYRETAAYSRDGRRAVFLTRHGNLKAGATFFTLHLATLADGTVTYQELARLSSTSNRPAIKAVRWISDERIGFVGEQTGGSPQVISVKVDGKLTIHTKPDGEKIGFDIGAGGTTVFGTPEPETDDELIEDSGYLVGDKTLAELVGVKFKYFRPTQYYVSRRGRTRRLDGLSNATSYFPPFISISPSGSYAVVETGPSRVPEEWAKFPLLVKATAGDPGGPWHSKLSLVDLKTGRRVELTYAPMAYPMNWTQIVWDEVHDRLFLIDQFVSGEQMAFVDATESLFPVTFEFSLEAMRPARLIDVSPEPDPYEKGMVADSAQFDTATGTLEIIRGDRLLRYQETPAGWRREGGAEGAGPAPKRPFRLEVRQSVSEPAQMYALVAGREDPIPVGEINAALKDKFNPARLYRWTDEAGRDWEAGLILPKGANEQDRLPLIIQTHSFSPREFVITGTRGSSAGFSGQALASAGFAVLNMGRQRREIVQTDEEFEVQSDGYRSAIKALNEGGIIDPDRVGAAAWSRSGLWLQPALAFQDNLFAAAIASDAASFGKWAYLYYHNWWSSWHGIFLKHNGSPPFGEGLDRWRERDPVTHVDAFTTPLLIARYGEGKKFPSWWEPYVAMKEAGEPVEYFILPNAPHDPIQPQHRLRVQTMSIDWFRFWLQGYEDEDPDSAKANQYTRWRAMRGEQCERLMGDDNAPWYCRH